MTDDSTIDSLSMYTPAQAAKLLGRAVGTLRNWRTQSIGPAFVQVRGRPLYRREDLLSYMRSLVRVTPAAAAKVEAICERL